MTVPDNTPDPYNIPNPVTDRYGLIWGGVVRNVIPFFGRVNFNDGFSREVFRNGRHFLSVGSARDTRFVLGGDVVLTVNLGICKLNFQGKLYSADHYTLTYDAMIDVRVSDSRLFAICCIQASDPLEQTRAAIDAALVKEVESDLHDDITAAKLRYIANLLVSRLQPEFGIMMVAAEKIVPYPDPHRAEEHEIGQQLRVDQAKVRAEGVIKQEQRVFEEQRLAEALRDLERKTWTELQLQAMSAHYAMQLEVQQKLVNFYLHQLEDYQQQGWTIAQIRESDPELGRFLDTMNANNGLIPADYKLMPPDSRRSGEFQTLGDPSPDVRSSDAPPPPIIIWPETSVVPPSKTEVALMVLGLTVQPIQMTTYQMDWSNATDNRAFLITRVDPKGNANKCCLDDIIVHIDDQAVVDVPTISRIVDAIDLKQKPTRLSILRKGQLQQIVLAISATTEEQ